ncbi:MAG: 50S ribosomal protein L11 methyltransferase [Chitinivibrionia bacterium]|nr:50S ribosomal protein L11 methyltransferase [Chitinivibrionia bacterium]
MTEFYTFDAIVDAQNLEELLAEAISDGFAGYNEIPDGEKIKIRFYYYNKDLANEICDVLRKKYEMSKVCEVENRDWNEEWKKTITPVKVADKIWVSPKWLEPTMFSGESWIKIEPQMAFGTGHHETTRIAAKLISQQYNGEKSLLDIGTGSGILAFVAQIVGYKSITGIEIDENCAENLQQNLEDNKGRADIRFIIGTIEKINVSAKFDAVAMNIIRSQSAPLLKDICSILSPNGVLIWSGILLEEKEKVIVEANDFGFDFRCEIIEKEWWGAKFIKK